MTTLPLDDARTYEMLARGDSTGVFQFESEGMREALKKVRPDEFNDLVALNALYRPGAMDQIPVYAKGKRNPQAITYPDERLRAILESSKGVILYQEQAMQISKELAGFSGAKADDLRKAIGKKNREAMAALKPEFVEGCRASGTSREVIEFLWQTNEKSADYSFNKSPRRLLRADRLPHGVAEGELPGRVHGGADLLGDVDQGQGARSSSPAARRWGSRSCRPTSTSQTTSSRSALRARGLVGNIRFGLDAVKGVGYQAVEAIKRAREEGGAFASLWDFCERVDSRTVNKKAIEALIKCGALGSTGASRKGMLEVLEQAQAAGQKVQQDALIGQGSIFDLARAAATPAGGRRAAPRRRARAPGPPADLRPRSSSRPSCSRVEKEAIGLFISAHPLKPLREALRARVDCPLAALAERRDKDWVTVGGIITEAKRIRTRNGDHMMFATLDDLAGRVEMLVFGKALAEHEAALAVDEVVLVQGPRRPQGSGQDVPGRAERRALRAHARRRSSARASRARARRARPPARSLSRCTCACDASALCGERDRGPQARDRGLPRRRPRCVLDIDTSAGTRRLRLGEGFRVAAHADAARRARTRARAACRCSGDGLRARSGCAQRLRARGDALVAQAHRERDFLARRAFAVLAGGLEHARQLLQRGRGEERGAALAPSSPVADVGVAVAVGAERRLRVVEVQRARRARGRACASTRAGRASMPSGVRMS